MRERPNMKAAEWHLSLENRYWTSKFRYFSNHLEAANTHKDDSVQYRMQPQAKNN